MTILMYHEVLPDAFARRELIKRMHHSYFVRETSFREQMEVLRENKSSTISLHELVDRINSPFGKELFGRAVAVTFDDGFEGNYKVAFPILKEHGLTATFFVTVGSVGKPFMMNWQQLREMAQCGMSIQSHTLTHRQLKYLKTREVVEELRESRRRLEAELGAEVDLLSLPHGSYGKEYRRIAAASGYRGGCCSKAGLNSRQTDRYLLRRVHISGRYGIEQFRRIVQQDQEFIRHIVLKDLLKSAVKSIVGENLYERAYNLLLGIEST